MLTDFLRGRVVDVSRTHHRSDHRHLPLRLLLVVAITVHVVFVAVVERLRLVVVDVERRVVDLGVALYERRRFTKVTRM